MIIKYLTAVFLLCMTVMPSYANDFTVKNIRVDVEAESAIDARNKALDQARRNAFNVMTDRMLSSEQKKTLPPASDSTIATMVDSFEINREKLSKNRYLASVNVAFNNNAMQAYFGRYSNVALTDDYNAMQNVGQGMDVNAPVNPRLGVNPMSDLYRSYQSQSQELSPSMPLGRDYKMMATINTISDLVSLRQSLESIGTVTFNSVKTKQVIMTLNYAGEATNLQNALNMKGMQIYSNTSMMNSDAPYILMVKG